ncbi:unknown [Eubacterium sp. CAG:786]|nr:unknown [Eubacterium sp. CAG:786]
MDLREEYKNEMESVSPDREAIDRMKAAVMAKIAAGEGEAGIPGEKKKPLPLRKIAYIGGAVAACAVIAVSAATILPSVNKNNGMISEAEISATAAGANEISGGGAADTAGSHETGSAANADTFRTEDDVAVEETTDGTAEAASDTATDDRFWDDSPDSGGVIDSITDSVPDDAVTPDAIPSDEPDKDNDTSPGKLDDNKGWHDFGENTLEPSYTDDGRNPESGFDTADIIDKPDTDQGDPGITGECTMEDFMTGDNSFDFDETADCAEETEEELDTEEVPEVRGETIIFTGRGWITFQGERYQKINMAAGAGERLQAYDPASGKHYTVVKKLSVIYVYQGGSYVGAYRKS